MFSPLTVTWVALNALGQWCMLVLLGTYLFAHELPGRKNIFLINFLLTIFIATFPPLLLFYTGQQGKVAPVHWVCVTQSVLMDGIAQMVGVAFVIFVFQTWAEMRAIICFKAYWVAMSSQARWTLILLPYATLAGWCMASLVQGFSPPATFQLAQFVYCANISFASRASVRERLGPFMIACGIVEIFFEVWIAILIIPHSRRNTQSLKSSPAPYHTNFYMYVRACIFTFLQLGPIFLAVLNKLALAEAVEIQTATQVLESLNAFATFFVFGSQMAVLEAWKIRSLVSSRGPKQVDGVIEVTGSKV